MKASLLQLRPFEAERDYLDFCSWYQAHGRTAPPKELLPPIGVIVYRDYGDRQEKTGMLFLYIAQGVGVAFVEYFVTPAGLTAGKAREIAVAGMDHLKIVARKLGYSVIVAHTVRGISRLMQHEGWTKTARELEELAIAT